MTEIDWDRLQPLRMAQGSHKAGSGFGCAMNVVSYIVGDTDITDFPECTDRNLARLVQYANDWLASYRGSTETYRELKTVPPVTLKMDNGKEASKTVFIEQYIQNQRVLTPEDAQTMIRLGTKTIGTAHTLGWGQILNLTTAAYRHWVGPMCNQSNRVLANLIQESVREEASPFIFISKLVTKSGLPFFNRLDGNRRAQQLIDFTEWVIDAWREAAALGESTVEVPNLESVLI